MAVADLSLQEGTALAHGLVARMLADAGIRAVFVKGPVASIQGLREPRVSMDVDVLCDPAEISRAQRVLETHGWRRFHGDDTDMLAIGMHSVTYRRAGWPSSIDLHHRFPGLLAPPQRCFDAIWQSRVEVDVAHQPLPAPPPAAHFLILLLHWLRHVSPGAERLSDAQLDRWTRVAAALPDVGVWALRLGGAEPARTVLDQLGIEIAPDARFAREYRFWLAARSAHGDSAVVWATRWRAAPWSRRPALVWRAFWDISIDAHMSPQEWASAGLRGRAAGRVRRAIRGAGRLARLLLRERRRP